VVKPEHLPDFLRGRKSARSAGDPAPLSDEAPGRSERETILRTLERCKGHRNRTAEALGIDRTTLWRKMKKLGI
jgi:transcriptional regulator of acetoin/glycerol metabolism